MKDLHSNIALFTAALAAVATADVTGLGIDSQGFLSVEHVVTIGQSGDALSGSVKIDLKLEESDDNSAWTAVTTADHVLFASTPSAGGIFATIDDAAEDETTISIGYRGNKRYSRVVADLTGTHTNGVPIAILAIKGHPAQTPTS